MLKRLTFALSLAMFTVAMPVLQALQQPPENPPSGFVSISEIPESEKLPAAPFLVAAYVFIWLIAMFYIWTIWKRVNKLEGEFAALERRSKGSTR
jgi:CcmD family protein